MKTLAFALLNVVLLMAAAVARAELTIEITQGMDNPTAIAVVPMAWQGAGSPPEDVALVIESDLVRSGQFAPVARSDMLGLPSTREEVFYRDWRALETEYLLIGKASPAPNDGLRIDYELFDVTRHGRAPWYNRFGCIDPRMLANILLGSRKMEVETCVHNIIKKHKILSRNETPPQQARQNSPPQEHRSLCSSPSPAQH